MSLREIFFWLVVGILVMPVVGAWGWLGIIGGLWAAGLVVRSR